MTLINDENAIVLAMSLKSDVAKAGSCRRWVTGPTRLIEKGNQDREIYKEGEDITRVIWPSFFLESSGSS
jgi:hypothetical protein